LTHHEAAQLLELSRLKFEAFLKHRNVGEHAYDVDDLEQDIATVRTLESSGRMRRSCSSSSLIRLRSITSFRSSTTQFYRCYTSASSYRQR